MSEIFLVMGVALLGAMSPGPDFFLVVKNSALYQRRYGIYTALGVMSGLIIHQIYCIAGLGWTISHSPFIFNLIKWGGGIYLFYLGLQSLFYKQNDQEQNFENHGTAKSINVFTQGFFCNALNPKASLFFIGFYALIIQPQATLFSKIIYGSTIVLTTGAWFIFLTILLNYPKIKSAFLKKQVLFVRIFGILLMGLALKILCI